MGVSVPRPPPRPLHLHVPSSRCWGAAAGRAPSTQAHAHATVALRDHVTLAWRSRAQALLCAYVDGQPEGSLSAEQLTQLAHAVRLAHLTHYFLAHVAPLVGWLCAEGRKSAVYGVGLARMGSPARSGTLAAWLPSAPARTSLLDPAARPVEWELPLAQLQPLVDRVAAGGGLERLSGPSAVVAFGLNWSLSLQVDSSKGATPGGVHVGLFMMSGFKHVPKPPADAQFWWVGLFDWLCLSDSPQPIAAGQSRVQNPGIVGVGGQGLLG
jgi:hypothetical protein